MTNLVLVPTTATPEMIVAGNMNAYPSNGYTAMLQASPYAKGVTREMVEKAAEASWDNTKRGVISWDNAPDELKELYRADVRVVLRSLGVKVEG